MTFPAHPRSLDVVVFGATGFVGRLVAGHLAAAAPAGLRVGLAGRSADRLAAVRDGLGPAAAHWPLLVADAGDPASLEQMAAAHPGRRLDGRSLCAATASRWWRPAPRPARTTPTSPARCCSCARSDRALPRRSRRSTGARIVHSCGFDSVPSDLGVLLAHEQAQADGEGPLEDTTLVVDRPARRRQRRHRRLDAAAAGGGPSDPAMRRVAGRPLRAEPRPRGRAGPRPAARRRRGEPRTRGRGEWLGAVRHGVVQHARRAAQQRAARTGPTAAVPLPGGDGLPGRGHRAGGGGRGDRRAGGLDGGHDGSARRVRCWTGCCPSRARDRTRRPATDGRFRVEMRATTATGASYTVVAAARRPRLRRDGGDARGERRGAGPRRGPARPGWGADAGDRAR